jgi:ectoine hydroxylase-related dioxygenase (phytanoyl-CoA dioxygenase family)
MDLKEKFEQQGYAVVPGVLSPESVATMRESLDRYFDGTESAAEMPTEDFLSDPSLWRIVFAEPIVDAMRTLLGGRYTLFPNFTVRKALYVGWHVDTAFAGPGKPHVWERDFGHVQGAIYLQDNDDASGGGLDFVQGSHRPAVPRLRGDHPVNVTLTSLLNGRVRRKATVRSRAGDLVLWHARTVHRSTPAKTGPSSRTKYGLFLSCGSEDPYAAHRYLTHLVGQAVQRENGDVKFVPRYKKILDVRYPDRFPEDFREAVREHDVTVSTF